jgi:hypothetical protein
MIEADTRGWHEESRSSRNGLRGIGGQSCSPARERRDSERWGRLSLAAQSLAWAKQGRVGTRAFISIFPLLPERATDEGGKA